MIDRLVCAVSAPWNPPGAVQSVGLLEQLSRQPAWRGGHPEPGAMVDWLTDLRIATLERYGIQVELAARFPDAAVRQAEVRRLARQWAEGFDAGSLVVLVFGSANRDESQYDDGEEFNPQRPNARTHLAFGQGIHACMGAALARLQTAGLRPLRRHAGQCSRGRRASLHHHEPQFPGSDGQPPRSNLAGVAPGRGGDCRTWTDS